MEQMEYLLSPQHKKYMFEQLMYEVAESEACDLSVDLKNELEELPFDARKEIVNSVKGRGSRSLLFIACQNGHRDKAEYLIRTCGADIKQKSHQAIPLWGAAVNGKLSTVELLVQAGADINAGSNNNGSTLVMCSSRHFEVVKYLVLHGANINKPNYKGETCLMNSVKMAATPTLCDFLLKNGADVNARDNQNKTALHYAIQECDLEATKLLLEHGADHTIKSSHGDDALQMACITGTIEIWEYLHLIISYSPERIANAQELLGASLVEECWEEQTDTSLSLNLWKQALIIRDENGLHPKRPVMPLQESYRNQTEFETLYELMGMCTDVDKMTIQSLLIAERILGIHHPDFVSRLENRGIVISYTNLNINVMVDYQRTIDLWRRALQLKIEQDTILHLDTSSFAETLVRLMLNFSIRSVRNNIGNTEQRFRDIVETFKVLTQSFEEIGSTLLVRPRCQKHFEASETIFRCISHLVYLLIETAKTTNNKELVTKLLPRVINFKCFCTGDSLLHVCTSRQRNTITSIFFSNEEQRGDIFPNVNILKQLLECGANVHARNKYGFTPLHVAVKYLCSDSVKLLLDLGAHIDESDGHGSTLFNRLRIFDFVARSNTDMLYFKYTNLQCLCANQILKNNIPYVDQLPKPLETFVNLHDPKRRKDYNYGYFRVNDNEEEEENDIFI